MDKGTADGVVHRIADAAGAAGFDAVVCLSPENVAYAAGFVVPSQPLMRWRHAAVVVTPEASMSMICVDMEESTVRQASPAATLRTWAEFGGSAMATLARLIDDMGLADARVGTELCYLSMQDHAELVGYLPKLRLGQAGGMLSDLRRIKTPAEVDLLTRLARIADTAIGDACAGVRAGALELDLAAVLTRRLYELGAQQFKLLIVASGPRSQLPNVGPTDRVLEPGDVCRIEIFPMIDGYHAGVCRTACVGESSPEARRVYGQLVRCRDVVLEALVPGRPTATVYQRFLEAFSALGVAPIAFVGHGIGLDLHEPPYLAAFSEDRVEAGMVLGVEPLAYKTGYGFGMQIKDMVAVDDDGARLLSDVTDTGSPLTIEV